MKKIIYSITIAFLNQTNCSDAPFTLQSPEALFGISDEEIQETQTFFEQAKKQREAQEANSERLFSLKALTQEIRNRQKEHKNSQAIRPPLGRTKRTLNQQNIRPKKHVIQVLICKFCKLEFNDQARLEVHTMTHHEHYRCNLCDGKFTSERGALSHHNRKHRDKASNIELIQIQPE